MAYLHRQSDSVNVALKNLQGSEKYLMTWYFGFEDF